MNKKIILIIIVFILLTSLVNADPFATIATTGLSFINPTASLIVNSIMCVTGPTGLITCATNYVEGKIIGIVQGEVLSQIAQSGVIGQQAVKAITTYNQVKGYLDEGASLIGELTLDENGAIETGEIHNIAKEGNDMGTLFGLNEKDVYGKNIGISDITKDANGNLVSRTITFDGDDSAFSITNENGIFDYINIKKQDENTNALIELDKDGNIISADFTTNDVGGNYKFPNNDLITVPGNTQIIYQDGIARVIGQGKTVKYLNNEITLNSEFVDISSNKITCVACSVGKRYLNGQIELVEGGYFLNYGSVSDTIYNLKIDTENKFFITDKDTTYEGNLVLFKKDSILIDNKDGQADINFLSGNKVLNIDDKDKLSFNIDGKNRVNIQNRNNLGLIPKIEYDNFDGTILIDNNDIHLEIENGNEIDASYKYPNLDYIYYNSPYQSVAFELVDNDKNIVINSYSQYKIFDKNGKTRVTHNEFDLPISTKIKDNNCQTLDCLKNDYKSIAFSANTFVKDEVHPFLLSYTNEWLKRNPDAVKNIKKINFVPSDESFLAFYYPGEQTISITDSLNEAHFYVEFNYKNEQTFSTLYHEYEHLKDDLIRIEEQRVIEQSLSPSQNTNNFPPLQSLYNSIAINSFNNLFSEDNKDNLNSQLKWVNDGNLGLLRDYQKEFKKAVEIIRSEELSFKDLDSAISGDDEFKKAIYIEKIASTMRFVDDEDEIDLDKKKFLEDYAKRTSQTTQFIKAFDSKFYRDQIIGADPYSVLNNIGIGEGVAYNVGLPKTYAFRNYGNLNEPEFLELSSTFTEEDIETKRAKVRSYNKLVRNNYIKLTQLAFDSGKMNPQEYQEILGLKCKTSNCIELKCVEYKLLCCQQYPGSPNCK